MKTLVIQLAKMGDLLQSVPLLERLNREGDRVTLLYNREFAETAGILPVAERIGVDFAVVTAMRDGKPRLDLHSGSAALLGELSGFGRIINLNSSPLACDFLPHLTAPLKLGFATNDPWSSTWLGFVLAFIRTRRFAPLNLVDIFRHLPGPIPTPPSEVRPFRLKDGRLRRIALQLGSRNYKRQWTPARFAELADQLVARGYAVVLTGTAGEAEAGKRFLEAVDSPSAVDNLIGATDLSRLAETLRTCDLLISGDTGTMHFASFVGIPVAAIFLGPAHAFETLSPGAQVFFPDESISCHPCDETAPCPNALACHRNFSPTEVVRQLDGSGDSLHAWNTVTDVIGSTLIPADGREMLPEIAFAHCYREYAARRWWNTEIQIPLPRLVELDADFERELRIFRSLSPEQRNPQGFKLLRPVIEMLRFRGIRDLAEETLDYLVARMRNPV
jgi:ADP-heptose:LPS heptosyltransferase